MSLVTRARPLVGALSLAFAALTLVPTPAQADGPGSGTPYVVSVGDSYISGEAGRWAGNIQRRRVARRRARHHGVLRQRLATPPSRSTAATAARAAEIYIGGGVNGLNLACSGAQDRDVHRRRRRLQARPRLLRQRRRQAGPGEDAAAVRGDPQRARWSSVSIGGNDFNFAERRAAVRRPTSSTRRRGGRTTATTTASSSPTSRAPNIAAVRRPRSRTRYLNIRTAMRNAGYADSSWTLLVQNYPSPIPNGSGLPLQRERLHAAEHRRLRLLERRRRLGQRHRAADDQQHRDRRDHAGRHHQRQDARTSRRRSTAAGSARARVGLLRGGRPRQLDERRRGRPDRVGQPDPHRHDGRDSHYYIQESLHPNYWGQLATAQLRAPGLQRRVRRKSGACVRTGTGLTSAASRA